MSQAGRLSYLLGPLDGFFAVEPTMDGVTVRWKGRAPDVVLDLAAECGYLPGSVTVVPSENSRADYDAEQQRLEQVLDGLPWTCLGPCLDGRTIQVELLAAGVDEAARRLAERRSTFGYAVSESEVGYPRAF